MNKKCLAIFKGFLHQVTSVIPILKPRTTFSVATGLGPTEVN